MGKSRGGWGSERGVGLGTSQVSWCPEGLAWWLSGQGDCPRDRKSRTRRSVGAGGRGLEGGLEGGQEEETTLRLAGTCRSLPKERWRVRSNKAKDRTRRDPQEGERRGEKTSRRPRGGRSVPLRKEAAGEMCTWCMQIEGPW